MGETVGNQIWRAIRTAEAAMPAKADLTDDQVDALVGRLVDTITAAILDQPTKREWLSATGPRRNG